MTPAWWRINGPFASAWPEDFRRGRRTLLVAAAVVAIGVSIAELPAPSATPVAPAAVHSAVLFEPAAAKKKKKHRYPWKQRVRAARRFALARGTPVSFAVVGEKGTLRGLRPRQQFSSASVVKAMLLVAYLRRNSVRKRPLGDSDHALLSPMIQRSDNSAATAASNVVGIAGLVRLAQAAKMRDFAPNVVWGGSQITARDQALFFWRLRRYIPRRHRAYAFFLLSHIVSHQRWGVPPARPRHWRVYFKGGFVPDEGGWRIHQVALLRRGHRRLAVAVLTDGNPSLEYGAATVEGIVARLLRRYNALMPPKGQKSQ